MPPKVSPRPSRRLSPEQTKALQLVGEDWGLALLGDDKALDRLQGLSPIIGKQSFEALLKYQSCTRIEDLERDMKWPARSGWTVMGVIADFLISIQAERDLLIY